MMQLVPHIVTDSTADIPPEAAQRLDLTVVPCNIHFGGQSFREGIDLTRQEFYRRLREWEPFYTSQPAVGVFAETYRRLLEDGRPIVSIHVASQLSGVYNSARLAADEIAPDRITLVDGRQVSMCTGWLAIGAAEAAATGASTNEVIRWAEEAKPRLRVLALIDDMRYLLRSGRVGWAAGLLGQIFSIKPIVEVREGRVDLAGKVRSQTRGLDRLVAMACELGDLARVAVLHADAPDAATGLAERVSAIFSREPLMVCEAGTVISGHAGPGATGLACLYESSLAG
jgi:DegV family protein with EDD domain